MDLSDLQSSPLEAQHRVAGGRLVPFAGWLLPVQYDGILAEHRAVREACGVFDISHMGQFLVQPAEDVDPREWLNTVLSNDIAQLKPGQGHYTLLLNEHGGILDDLIAYRTGENRFLLIVNASRREQNLEWLTTRAPAGMILIDRSISYGAIAVQGPHVPGVFASMFPDGPALPSRFGVVECGELAICRTGYTGEDGFELCAPAEELPQWWNRAVAAGAKPCGLGARDLLRLEKCYPLNGSDLSGGTTPWEAGLGFAVALEKGDFVGRDALLKQRADGVERRLVALRLTGKTPPPRPGYAIFASQEGGEALGKLTSGGFSPGLEAGIALAYVPVAQCRKGHHLWLEVRGQRYPAEVVPKPFL